MRITAFCLLLLPVDAFACMISPTHSYTLTFGVIKLVIGLSILFFSTRLYFRGSKLFLYLFGALVVMVIVGSTNSVIFRYGLYSDPACGTQFGLQTGMFFLVCLALSLVFLITFYFKKYKANNGV